ncbi:acetate--CoA ligase [Cellulomonas fimi]|uniref:Acetate--CoA ligase n=1 Tax=Cellulomonas fimi TaxID=1708 RepID=A0A7Y0QHX8_CELFI|nr:acetate--CoA ligase [Cellulomonas fimi]NMR19637.1 acetate--CoA ligase [Cellulomonas fimi]
MTTAGPELLARERTYPAPPAFAADAHLDAGVYAEADADPVAFWERAADRLEWAERWHTAHTWAPAERAPSAADGAPGDLSVPAAQWFVGGRLNVAVNCVDRHVAAGRGDKVALHFEGEPGDRRTLTYAELQREVSRAANALRSLGVGQGDRVVVYLPVLPETVVITLAIARIGAVHSLVFGGFSAEAVRFRLEDTGAKLLVTSDGQFRRGRATETKSAADAAIAGLPGAGPDGLGSAVEHVLVVRRTGDATPDIPWTPGRDVWWHDVVDTADDVHVPEAFDSETPLFIIYTSGTTGRPKGLVHTSGGYLTQASYTHWAHFDARDDDVHWCTADLAWVTAHTYEIYGPLSNGLTQVIYEGTPGTPTPTRHLEIIERYGVTTYYTAPTLIRTLMTWFPDGPPPEHDLSSIRLLGTVGESINPQAWAWFHRHLGRGEAPVVDTWWQSETGATVVAPLPGVTTLKPGSAGRPSPGSSVRVVDEAGDDVGPGEHGFLVIDRPWPSMARTIWGDPERYRDSYWARYADRGYFFAGDGARFDADGDLWLLGRVDEVINVSGHRLSTIEVESALVAHPAVAEAGVTGVADTTTGQAIAAFVVPTAPPGRPDLPDDVARWDAADLAAWRGEAARLRDTLREQVAREIGPIAKPRDVVVVPEVPKTRSGKIMRRLLADLAARETLGDTTSLQNPWAVEQVDAILHDDAARTARPHQDRTSPAPEETHA